MIQAFDYNVLLNEAQVLNCFSNKQKLVGLIK